MLEPEVESAGEHSRRGEGDAIEGECEKGRCGGRSEGGQDGPSSGFVEILSGSDHKFGARAFDDPIASLPKLVISPSCNFR